MRLPTTINKVDLICAPGYENTIGNEKADELAKIGASSTPK